MTWDWLDPVYSSDALDEAKARERNRVLEEAACIADDCEVGPEHVNAAIKIAEAIRARKEQI